MKRWNKDDICGVDHRPSVEHDSFDEAEQEAMRLAIIHRGHSFDVLQVQRRISALVMHVEKFPA